MVGQTISHYKVLEKVGEGGMGEVYRAEDTHLKREVAIKVLPEQFTQDAQRLARFEREAQLLASLSHPNIAAVYSFEHAEDTHFLVMELVEGEDLSQKVSRGPLPVEEALQVCLQVAEGVEAAHEKGVIHRDLKPANVKITPEGKVKVLDFGLAKMLEDEVTPVDISHSPTLTHEMTRAGVILGTAGYMSPEQAKGKPVDKRADVWAFGCVLYELLTGKRAFEGETTAETIASVLKSEPDWEALPGTTPWRVKDLLRRCLEKDPHDRLHDIANVRIEVKQVLSEPEVISATGATSTVKPVRWRQAIPWSIAAVMAVTFAIMLWLDQLMIPREQAPLSRLSLSTQPLAVLTHAPGPVVALSPDSAQLVYVAGDRLRGQLYLRELGELEAKAIPGADDAYSPFFSPDGKWIAFFTRDKLKKVALQGGPAVTVCDVNFAHGGCWGDDDTIIFAGLTGLFRVPAGGGNPEPVTTLDSAENEGYHTWPEILPGSDAVLFTVVDAQGGNPRIWVQSLATGQRRLLVEEGGNARYTSSGHLIYALQGSLLAVPFDPDRLELKGFAVPVVEGTMMELGLEPSLAHFAVSGNGTLAYLAGTVQPINRTLVWVDRRGEVEPLAAEPGPYRYPRLSPDGSRVAFTTEGNDADVWIYDLTRQTQTRLTFDPAIDQSAIWTPDGRRVVFSSTRDGGQSNLYWKAADGTGQVERLTTSPHFQAPHSFTPDGKILVFMSADLAKGPDLYVLSMEGEPSAKPLLQTQFFEFDPEISPDGQWIAYLSNESGRFEVYVRPFPNVEDGKWQISREGGTTPVWGPNGQELFYQELDRQELDRKMVVRFETTPTFTPGSPEVLLAGRYFRHRGRHYDISPDGKRLLMIKEAEQTDGTSAPSELIIVLNWFEELKRLVPTE